MNTSNCSFACLALSVSLTFAAPAVWALNPGNPPGSNFDLSHWYLGLPVDSSGGTNGNSASISAAQLTSGYTSEWFYTGSDGSMVFWAWVVGATTSGSSYPRSELREQITPADNGVNWFAYGTHILNARCQVWQLPSTKKVIIGQIHGYTGAALPLVKVQYNSGKLEALIKTNSTDDGSDYKFSFGSGSVSNEITYQIKVVNGLVSIAINGTTNSLNVFQSDPGWATNTMYFKAGSYCQDNSGPTNEGARMAFYALNVSHAPSITNQPASQVVTVGSNVTFTVGAAGNPPLRYFWQFNGAPLSGKTNATLSIPNVQLTDAGSYSVIITDSVGTVTSVVTSSVATLTVNPLAPVAEFTASPTNGVAPLNVNFADTSSNSPTNWAWSFGDGGASSLQHPSHSYPTAGVYTVQLIARNGGGSSTNTKAAYIHLITPLQSWSDCYGVPGDPGDADGDGLSNTNEFLAGFNPTCGECYLRILDVTKSGNDMDIAYVGADGDNTWVPGIVSRTNILEYSTGDANGNYSNNFVSTGQTNILRGGTGTGVLTSMVDYGGATNVPSRYYRVRVLTP